GRLELRRRLASAPLDVGEESEKARRGGDPALHGAMLHWRVFSPRPSRRRPEAAMRDAAASVHGKSEIRERRSTMNEYEILLMLDVDLPDERAEETLTGMREWIESEGGTWDGHEPGGRRKLAYEIGHKGEGAYHLVLFTAAPATLAEISRVLKITDGVMRHLAVNRVKGGQLKAPAPIAAVSISADDSDTAAE